MSSEDSTYWRARAEEMRALAETVEGEISKLLMYRIAEDYEWFAQTVEQRPDRFLPALEAAVPAEVKQFGQRTRSAGAPSPEFSDSDLPDFLKRGPATVDEPSRDKKS